MFGSCGVPEILYGDRDLFVTTAMTGILKNLVLPEFLLSECTFSQLFSKIILYINKIVFVCKDTNKLCFNNETTKAIFVSWLQSIENAFANFSIKIEYVFNNRCFYINILNNEEFDILMGFLKLEGLTSTPTELRAYLENQAANFFINPSYTFSNCTALKTTNFPILKGCTHV